MEVLLPIICTAIFESFLHILNLAKSWVIGILNILLLIQ